MDLSAFPPAALWRWDLAARLLASVVVPLVALYALPDVSVVVALCAAMAAALVSLSSLGPDLSSRGWIAVAALGVPLAMIAGALAGRLPGAGVALVFVLFTVHGAMIRAGLIAQIAWFTVATGGLLAALLVTEDVGVSDVAGGAALGSGLAVALLWIVPKVLSAPRLPLPPEALAPDTERLRRMVTAPTWRDWMAPLALGGMSAALLLAATALTAGFKPYWAVLAFVSVLAPTSAKTRESAVETVVATVIGVALAAGVLALGLPVAVEVGLITLLGVLGALLIIRNGTASKALLTPLPVVIAAGALDAQGALAFQLRLVEYVVGALLGAAAAVAAEFLGRRLWRDRDEPDVELVG